MDEARAESDRHHAETGELLEEMDGAADQMGCVH
jgi:hypothetical protein